MTEFDKNRLREAIYTAKIVVFATGSTDPDKQEKLSRLRWTMNEAQRLCDEILDEGMGTKP